ncbi:MAG: ParB N-terminal domain-containing protein [Candidatus Krumholzibacteriota bacterium]|nr:ParB N-terminal domain-containing protein [Candidatus Krumholzibacteriota bacterium]
MQNRRIATIIPPKPEKIRESLFCFRKVLPGEAEAGTACSELIESVRSSGIIVPPLLTPSETIILGHRRIAAASAAGLREIEVLVADVEDPASFVRFWLEDSLRGEELSELEKIILAKKASGFFPKDPSCVLSSLSKIFGRTLSAGALREMTGLLDKDPQVLEALHSGYVKPADLLRLSSIKAVDLTRAVGFLSENSLSRAEQKESVRLINYLADQGDGKWKTFAAEYEKSGGSFPERLKAACYPDLTRDIRAIDEIIAGIRLPQHAKISPPANLEGGAYQLNIRIRDEEKLASAIEKIRSALDDGKIADLLDILKRGAGR